MSNHDFIEISVEEFLAKLGELQAAAHHLVRGLYRLIEVSQELYLEMRDLDDDERVELIAMNLPDAVFEREILQWSESGLFRLWEDEQDTKISLADTITSTWHVADVLFDAFVCRFAEIADEILRPEVVNLYGAIGHGYFEALENWAKVVLRTVHDVAARGFDEPPRFEGPFAPLSIHITPQRSFAVVSSIVEAFVEQQNTEVEANIHVLIDEEARIVIDYIRFECGEDQTGNASSDSEAKLVGSPESTELAGTPTSAANCANERSASINTRMIETLHKRPEAINWSVRKWADYLNCGKSTVAETRIWKSLKVSKAESQLNRISRLRRDDPAG